MGKVARQIIKISNPKDRRITFRKRLHGLIKKAYEIGILCDQDTFVFVRDRETHRVRMFSSTNENFIPQYGAITDEDRRGPSDMQVYHEKTPRKPAVSTAPARPLSVSRRQNFYTSLLQKTMACHDILKAIV